nr:PDR/VanB family oxidoreductase [Herbihabitans rhizosphaerae]
MSRSSGTREVTVTEVRPLAEDVVGLTLADRKGGELPAWEPGAHVDLVLPSGLVRQYSLCGDPADRTSYQVAVLLERDGRGGSREIHRLRPGQRIGVRGPRNNFPLVDAPAYLFVAGGIGVTPLLPMIREVAARGLPWRLAYLGRSPRTMAFAADLRASAGVRLYPKDAGRRADLAELVRTAPPATHVYACGPHRLMDALERMVPAERLHVEHFAAAADTAPKRPFTAELARTGATVAVPAGRTLLDAVREYAPGLEASCENGVCGTCRITVLRGTPEHRDSVLQPAERGRTDVVYACVSRSKSQRLVLDV